MTKQLEIATAKNVTRKRNETKARNDHLISAFLDPKPEKIDLLCQIEGKTRAPYGSAHGNVRELAVTDLGHYTLGSKPQHSKLTP